jgi:hypothetical protein
MNALPAVALAVALAGCSDSSEPLQAADAGPEIALLAAQSTARLTARTCRAGEGAVAWSAFASPTVGVELAGAGFFDDSVVLFRHPNASPTWRTLPAVYRSAERVEAYSIPDVGVNNPPFEDFCRPSSDARTDRCTGPGVPDDGCRRVHCGHYHFRVEQHAGGNVLSNVLGDIAFCFEVP